MHRWRWAAGPLVLGLLVLTAGVLRAERVPSQKTVVPRDPGTRGDITVPYLTNGYSALGVYQGVAPRIYASPILDDPKAPQARPVYNLIFYGATQAFGDESQGAVSRRSPSRPIEGCAAPRTRCAASSHLFLEKRTAAIRVFSG